MIIETRGDRAAETNEKQAPEQANEKPEEYALFERLFEKSPDAVVVVDGEGVIVKVNQQTEALFGYRREELIGRHVEILIPDRFHERHCQDRRHYMSDPQPRKMGGTLELYGKHSQGWEIPLDIMLAPIECEKGPWVLAVARDITLQKEYQARLNQLNAQMKTQIQQLAAANRELESFSYSVSHDLRAPLRHITGFVSLLDKMDRSRLDEKGWHYLQVISDAAQKMGMLIDDILTFSRMGRVDMTKTSVDLGRMVKEVVRELSEETSERNVELRIGPLPTVVGDGAMLRLVLVNLISNALKFTKPRPKARIEIGAVTDQPEEYRFYVRDNGVGFDPQYAGKLFRLFQRLHSANEFEGTGVGLANVQRILSRHRGRAWAEGSLDAGATFWFALPKVEGME